MWDLSVSKCPLLDCQQLHGAIFGDPDGPFWSLLLSGWEAIHLRTGRMLTVGLSGGLSLCFPSPSGAYVLVLLRFEHCWAPPLSHLNLFCLPHFVLICSSQGIKKKKSINNLGLETSL